MGKKFHHREYLLCLELSLLVYDILYLVHIQIFASEPTENFSYIPLLNHLVPSCKVIHKKMELEKNKYRELAAIQLKAERALKHSATWLDVFK